MTVSVIPEEVRAVKLTFNPPEEPNGNITEYIVYIFEKDQLVRNISLNIIQKENNTMDAVIEGLKGGRTYSLQVKNTPLCEVNSFLFIANLRFGVQVLHVRKTMSPKNYKTNIQYCANGSSDGSDYPTSWL